MEFHFYASKEAISDIRNGLEATVHTKDGRLPNENIHVSFNVEKYDIFQASDNVDLFKVNRNKNAPYSDKEGRDIDV